MSRQQRADELETFPDHVLWWLAARWGRRYDLMESPDRQECIRFILAMEFDPGAISAYSRWVGCPIDNLVLH